MMSSDVLPGTPPRPMSRIEYGQGETIVHLRVRGGVLTIITHLLVLIVGGFAGLFVALMMVAAAGEPAFYQVWLTLWTALLIFTFVRLLWFLFGREKLIASNAGLDVVRSILWIPNRQHYAVNEVGAMRYLPNDPRRSVKINNRRIPQPALGIVLKGREICFAHGISESETRQIIGALRQRLVPGGRVR